MPYFIFWLKRNIFLVTKLPGNLMVGQNWSLCVAKGPDTIISPLDFNSVGVCLFFVFFYMTASLGKCKMHGHTRKANLNLQISTICC